MKTILEIIDTLENKLPKTHGGAPILVCGEDLDSDHNDLFMQLHEEGTIPIVKIVTIQEDASADGVFWIHLQISKRGEPIKSLMLEQFGKTDDLDSIVDTVKIYLKKQ